MRNRTTLGILCIVASLILCFVVTPFINSGFSAKTKIVRMKSDAKAGQKLEASMLEEVEVGKYNLPTEVIVSKNDAVGKFLTIDVLAGDYLLAGKVTDEPERENEPQSPDLSPAEILLHPSHVRKEAWKLPDAAYLLRQDRKGSDRILHLLL